MILAAGLGTRLKPFTDKHPKALVPVNGKSVLQRNVEYLHQYGIKDIIVNVHHFAHQIIDAVKENNGWGASIAISNESDEILETGGGLKNTAAFFTETNEPFVLMNADILTDMKLDEMIAQHLLHKPLATLAVTERSTSRYLLFNEKNSLCGWLNEKTGEQKGDSGTKKAFSGIHIISPQIFSLITETGKFSMIDLYLRLAKNQQIMAYDHSNTNLIDCGRPESIAVAEKMYL